MYVCVLGKRGGCNLPVESRGAIMKLKDSTQSNRNGADATLVIATVGAVACPVLGPESLAQRIGIWDLWICSQMLYH